MKHLMGKGTTVLFVSHSDDQVKEICQRAIWLSHGEVMADGPAAEVCEQYRAALG